MAEKKRALLPPSYQVQGTPNDGNHIKVKEINNPVYEEEEPSQQIKKTTLPLPDYETLFPQKRHGVQGHTQWDHIIAEVNQKYTDTLPKFSGKEMSVDGPEDYYSTMSSPQQKNPAFRNYQTKSQDTKLTTSQKAASQSTPQTGTPPHPQPTPDFSQRHQINTPLTFKKDTPTAKARQKINGNRLIQEQDSASKPVASLAGSLTSNANTSDMDKRGQWTEDFAVFDPFPSTDFLSKDPWTQLTNNHQDPFTGGGQKEQKFEDCGMTVEDLNCVFSQNKPVDEFKQDSNQAKPSFKRVQNQSIASTTQLNKTGTSHEASTPITKPDHISLARNTKNESLSQKPQADEAILNAVGRKTNPFGTEPVSVIPPRTLSETPQVVMEENMEFQAENGSSGKMPLRAWVSPSEVQPASPQNGSGSGQVIFPRR